MLMTLPRPQQRRMLTIPCPILLRSTVMPSLTMRVVHNRLETNIVMIRFMATMMLSLRRVLERGLFDELRCAVIAVCVCWS